MRERATWRIGRRELYAMVGGAVLYAVLCWLTNIFQLKAAADLQVRPGVSVPIFFGFVFGPVVGFVTGALGNFMADLASGLLPYPPAVPMGRPVFDLLRSHLLNFQIGNGIMGLIPGIAALYYRRYFSLRDQLRALAVAALGVVVGMAFASFSHMLVDPTVDVNGALHQYLIPIARVNLVNSLIVVPILLFNYERFDLRSTDWIHSDIMRRLSIAILVSAALPVGLLSVFLTQQTTGTETSSLELTGKLAFTVVLTLLFTVTNAGMLAQSMVRPLLRLTNAARLMETGQLGQDQAAELERTTGNDEINHLTHVFGRMAKEVLAREDRLKQQVVKLRIEIDEAKKSQQVAQVTETDYFKSLSARAKEMREKIKGA